MVRTRFALVVALSLFFAGCAGLAPTASQSNTATPTAASPTATPESPTATPTTATPTPVDVEYVLRAGSIPDTVESVQVTLQVVFVERSDDVGPCWRETYYGPYQPTPTPIRMPSDECYRSAPVTVDLTQLDGERSLGRQTAPGRFTAGHALLVTNVTATYRNGTAVTGIRGASGKRATVVRGRPAGRHQVTLALESYADRDYDYWLVTGDDG